MSTQELNIYKSLFRKVNLKEHMVYIPEYLQPLTYMALETDELLRQILIMLAYIGTDVHTKEFKKFLLEYKVDEIQTDKTIIKKAFITKTTLNNKLKTLELINLIEIKDYRIRLTSQALSYYNDIYTKTENRATFESKLERVTKAKLIAYTSAAVVVPNDKELEKQNIYRYSPNGFVVLKSNDRETFKMYKTKLEGIKSIISLEIKNTLKDVSVEYMKNKNIDSNEFKAVTLDDVTIEIKLEKDIYNNYKEKIDRVFNNEILMEEWGYKVCATIYISYQISTYN